MKKPIVSVLAVVIGVGVIATAVYIWRRPELWVPLVDPLYARAIHQRRSVLYQTEHSQLLDACRNVIVNRDVYKTVPWRSDGTNVLWLDPGDSRLPECLRSIRPAIIVVDQSRLRADLYSCDGSCVHFGVVAYLDPDDHSDTNFLIAGHSYAPGFHGFKQLASGLYYYDEWASSFPDKWQSKLERLRPRETRKRTKN